MSIPKKEDIDGKAMFTTLLSKGVMNELREVISSTVHLYEEDSTDDAKAFFSHVVREHS
jgi:hypothetical protein